MIFRIFATLVLLAVIAGSLFLGRERRSADTPAAANRRTEALGYAALDAQLIETGADGWPRYTLNAKRIEQDPKDQSVQLQTVHMILNDADGNRWTVDAARGDIVGDGVNIELSGDVHVSGMLPGSEQSADITTDRLSFDTNADIVTSTDPVTFSWAGRQIHSVGIVANLKDSHVQLESAVHGIFRP
jgi:LPS export ABC transporter protein LptC